MNRFDEFTVNMSRQCPELTMMALIDVADTTYLAKLWFESHEVKATAADLLKFTELVLDREKYRACP